MRNSSNLQWSLVAGIIALFSTSVQAQLNTITSFQNLVEAFPPLHGFEQRLQLTKAPRIGRQNFTQCCVQAVSESYIIQDGKVLNNPTLGSNYITLSPADLNKTQFPCGASYKGNDAGAPEVRVPYSWCHDNCGGWQRSSNAALSEWVQPFVGFILPSAVFCLHVPRKFVVAISDGFFSNDFVDLITKWDDFWKPLKVLLLLGFLSIKKKIRRQTEETEQSPETAPKQELGGKLIIIATNFGALCIFVFISTISTIIRATIAASIALSNTIFWVAVVFSAATPMILSGLYEASLDRNVIKDMRHSLRTARAWRNREDKTKDDPVGKRENDTEKDHFNERVHQLYAVLIGNLTLAKTEENEGSPTNSNIEVSSNTVWEDVEALVIPKHHAGNTDPKASKSAPTAEDLLRLLYHKQTTATRLKGMLGCQASFGAAVGAPVVFFIGSFLFSVISNLSAVGDNNTSHALAFGMWWMTIPHVAIVSGCLLAGNNPNPLEVIVSGVVASSHNRKTQHKKGKGKWHQPFYQTAYTPVWMLERGRNKQAWIDRLAVTYFHASDLPEDSNKRRRAFSLDLIDWLEIGLITIVLVVLPFVLAFITSYFTPRVGLACRTFTFLLYFLFQLCYSLLWLWDFFKPQRMTQNVAWLPRGKKVNTKGQPSSNAPTIYGALLFFVTLGSGFTAVVGTFLQILGVYRNCLCSLPIQYWGSSTSYITISTNSALAIHLASNFWLPTGIASIILLIVTCYGGWWYQRHWRQQFTLVVDLLCAGVEEQIEDGAAEPGFLKRMMTGGPFVTEKEIGEHVETERTSSHVVEVVPKVAGDPIEALPNAEQQTVIKVAEVVIPSPEMPVVDEVKGAENEKDIK